MALGFDMAIRNLAKGQISRPAPHAISTARIPAPIKGIDARIALTEGAPLNCVYNYNMVPFEYGMAIRKGFREYQIEIDAGDSAGVHTIIPFDGVEENGVQDKLFAVNNEGIWDVTIAAAVPIQKVVFADQQAQAGYGVYTHYTDDAERDVLFYADNFNGLFEYDASGDTWAQATGITGPIISNIRFIVSHKQRLWLIEENSTKAWYLPIGSNSGQAKEFFFGSKFKHGGNLEGLFNWTIDGGDGVDDYLVAVSRSGDVLPYRGADPSSADTWSVVGTFFIGEIPRGPHFGSQHGGELYLLSEYGLTSMNDLLQGVNSATIGAMDNGQTSISGQITGLLRGRMAQTIDDFGWQVQLAPSEGALVIASPRIGSGPFIQYVYNTATRGWGLWRGVPMTHFDSWHGAVIFGHLDNKIYRMDVTADNVTIEVPANGINGDPIEFSVLTSYQSLGAEALFKKVKLIRADFVADGPPVYTAVARYDYDIEEALLPASPPLRGGDIWDIGLWDTAIWGAGGNEAYNGLNGSWGDGRTVAIAIRGQVRELTRLIGFDIMYTTGGPLQ